MDDRFLTAQEAAAELGISLATLYAYASRGMLRSEAVPGEPRARRYPREDVLRLKDKKELRRYPEQAAEKAAPKALSWGMPVLESALTLIRDGRLYYRGRDAVELARTATVEEVAALLWTGDPGEAGRLFGDAPGVSGEPPRSAWHLLEGLTPIERCQVAIPLAGAADLSAWDLRPAAVAATGARILRLMAAGGPGSRPPGGVAAVLQAGWAPGRPEVAGPIARR
jgi:citrate synthase